MRNLLILLLAVSFSAFAHTSDVGSAKPGAEPVDRVEQYKAQGWPTYCEFWTRTAVYGVQARIEDVPKENLAIIDARTANEHDESMAAVYAGWDWADRQINEGHNLKTMEPARIVKEFLGACMKRHEVKVLPPFKNDFVADKFPTAIRVASSDKIREVVCWNKAATAAVLMRALNYGASDEEAIKIAATPQESQDNIQELRMLVGAAKAWPGDPAAFLKHVHNKCIGKDV